MKKTFLSKLFSRFTPGGSAGESGAARARKPGIPEPKLVFFIVDWNRAAVISKVFVEEKTGFHFISRGRGTASSEVLNLLGIGASDKAVALCLEQPGMVPVLVREVRKQLGFYNAGAGIAFTVPLSGINGPVLRLLKQPETEKSAEQNLPAGGLDRQKAGGEKIFLNYLIVSVINKGYSEVFMNTARAAGAGGGTVLNARGRAHEEAVKVFGISVQEEKEAIIILADREKKDRIMRAVSGAHGPDSDARGLVLSLPVDSVMSLSSLSEK